MPQSLNDANRRRLVVSLIAEEISRLRQREVPPAESLGWTDAIALGEEGSGSLGLDSLGRIDVAGRLNQFFHLHEVGIEDYLLIEKTIGRWCAIVAKSEEIGWSRVTFQTSGSTGQPKTCTHDLADIAAEVQEQIEVFRRPRRIVSLVPPHHIYGFIFTILLPEALGVDVLDARALSPGQLRAALRQGDLLVATPHLWRYLAMSLGGFPEGVAGATSTAPMPKDLAIELRASGLHRLVEVYGSSETSGIGWRDDPDAPFTLYAAWDVSADRAAISRRRPDGSFSEPFPFVDEVAFDGPRRLRPVGRRDGAVQVGGVNVFPARVKQVLEELDGVAAAAVRTFAAGGDAARQRLKAFIVPAPGADTVALEDAIRDHAATRLSAVERPAAYAFGDALPVNAMGKLADWN
ncbi:MAG: 4-coumarate--CoA ligase [Beijerinckiaceae bacterium]